MFNSNTRRRAGVPRVFAYLGLIAMACLAADGQAWVPQRGKGAVTLAYQRISNTGHRLTGGLVDPGGDSLNMSAYLGVDYAATNRVSFSLGMPYVWGKFLDTTAPPGLPFLAWDKCRC